MPEAADIGPEAADRVVYGWTDAAQWVHHRYLIPSIEALLPRSGGLRILDAGCGNGYIAQHLAGLGHIVTGVDQSPDGIELAREAFPNVRYEVGSVYEELSSLTPEGGFDVIVASEVIEHLLYPRVFVENMNRHLSAGGHLILTTPYHGYLKNLAISALNGWDKHFTVDWEGGHVKFFSQKTIGSLLEDCGFGEVVFRNVGRAPLLWKSMVCRATKLRGSCVF